MVEKHDKIYIEDYNPEEDPVFVDKVLTPFLNDIFADFKMRGGKDCKGFTKPMWLEYSRLPEALAMRIFSVFDKDNNGTLTDQEFCPGLASIFIGKIEDKLEFVFNIFDSDGKGKLNEGMVKHLLQYCNFDNYTEDEDVEGE